MFNFLNFKFDAFGLDISTKSLKIVKIEKKNGKLFIVSFGQENIPDGIIENGIVKQEEELANIIQKSLKNITGKKIKTPYVIISLPEERSYLEVLKIPKVEDNEIKKIIELNTQTHIPLPISECYFNYKKNEVGENYIEVLLAAIPKEVLDSYINTLKKTNLKAVGMEIESEAIIKAVISSSENTKEPILIIDFGQTRTGLIFYEKNIIRNTTTIPISAELFTLAIQKALKVSFEEAEKIKIKNGLIHQEGEIFDAMVPPLKDLIDQLKLRIDYYEKYGKLNNKTKISKIILCGGGSKLYGLTNIVQIMINIKTELANPLLNIYPTKDFILDKKEALSFTSAIGLAIDGANLEETYD
ncbi:MAG: type IV pilus assembly protein PilM [Minisyncoccia bacterium]